MTLRFRSALSALGGKTFLTLMTAWTLVAAGILGLILYSSAREDRVIALNRATDSYRKDLVYRRWAVHVARHQQWVFLLLRFQVVGQFT